MALSQVSRGVGEDFDASEDLTWEISPASNFTATAIAILAVAYENGGVGGTDTLLSVADSHGNTWDTRVTERRSPGNTPRDGQILRLLVCRQDVAPLTTSSVITLTFQASGANFIRSKVYSLIEVVSSDSKVGVIAYGSGLTGSTTLTLAIPTTFMAIGQMVVGIITAKTNVDPTPDSDTLNGSWSTAQQAHTTAGASSTDNLSITMQTKVLTAVAAQSYDVAYPVGPSLLTRAAGVFLQLYEGIAPTPASLIITGVVPVLGGDPATPDVTMDARISEEINRTVQVLT